MQTTIETIERLTLGNNREVMILGLGIPYREALQFDRNGVLLRLSSEGTKREVLGSLAFMNPMDGPALVTVAESEAGAVREGDSLEIVSP